MKQYLDVLPKKREIYYNGGWHSARSGATAEIANPATGESLGSVAIAEADDVDAAVSAAHEGFEFWRKTKPADRAAILRTAASIIRAHAEEIALIDSADSGGPFRRMIQDAEGGAEAF